MLWRSWVLIGVVWRSRAYQGAWRRTTAYHGASDLDLSNVPHLSHITHENTLLWFAFRNCERIVVMVGLVSVVGL